MKKSMVFSILMGAGAVTGVCADEASAAYNITIPAVPHESIAIPRVPPVKIRYEENATGNEREAGHAVSSKGLVRAIGFSKRTPPNWDKKETVKTTKNAQVGDVNGSRVSLYLRGPLMDEAAVKSALEKAGFSVLAAFAIDKKKKLVSVVFTDESLAEHAAKPKRGFAASLRVLVDRKNGQISIMNPLYVEKAFLQDDYDEAAAQKTLQKLRGAFSGLKNSDDSLKYALLPKYHFMDAMPYYQDMVEVGSGSNDVLLEKARKSKKLAFEQKLSNGAVLIGVKLGRRTSKFVKKIGYHNAALLPYPVLIENGKAKILEPKYYIAVMYPQLAMSEFMTIATVPGAIQKECDKIFR